MGASLVLAKNISDHTRNIFKMNFLEQGVKCDFYDCKDKKPIDVYNHLFELQDNTYLYNFNKIDVTHIEGIAVRARTVHLILSRFYENSSLHGTNPVVVIDTDVGTRAWYNVDNMRFEDVEDIPRILKFTPNFICEEFPNKSFRVDKCRLTDADDIKKDFNINEILYILNNKYFIVEK